MPFIPNARRTKEKTMPGVFEASGTRQAVLKMCAAYARARGTLQTMRSLGITSLLYHAPGKKARATWMKMPGIVFYAQPPTSFPEPAGQGLRFIIDADRDHSAPGRLRAAPA